MNEAMKLRGMGDSLDTPSGIHTGFHPAQLIPEQRGSQCGPHAFRLLVLACIACGSWFPSLPCRLILRTKPSSPWHLLLSEALTWMRRSVALVT